MFRQRSNSSKCLCILLFLMTFSACTNRKVEQNLESVAKDWSKTIRASQVIPVYPLTEDLQPGDVLLVSTPIENQVDLYNEKGFLPLDQHLVRLSTLKLTDNNTPDDTKDFNFLYSNMYETEQFKGIRPAFCNNNNNIVELPLVGFPSYSFRVDNQKGLGLAIPIQGVPVAMGLMNATSATGTVTIENALAYGLDRISLENIVREWGEQNKDYLKQYKPRGKDIFYLRIINRVYMVKDLNVSLIKTNRFGAGAQGQIPIEKIQEQVAEILAAEPPQDSNTLQDSDTPPSEIPTVREEVENLIAQELGNANIEVLSSTGRTIAMNTSFTRPLVIGYIGFDIPILKDGKLGSAISTLDQLEGRPTISISSFNNYKLSSLVPLYVELDPNSPIKAKLDDLSKEIIPEKYPFNVWKKNAPGKYEIAKDKMKGDTIPKKEREDFIGLISYLGETNHTKDLLYEKKVRIDNEDLIDVEKSLKEIKNKSSNTLAETIDMLIEESFYD